MTYDQLEKYLKRFVHGDTIRDFLFVDEAHLISQYQNISKEKQTKLQEILFADSLKIIFNKVIHTTATPFNLPNMYENKLSFVKTSSNKNVCLYHTQERLGQTKLDKVFYYSNIMKAIKPNFSGKWLIFPRGTKEELIAFTEALGSIYGVKTEFVCSENQKTSEVFNYLVNTTEKQKEEEGLTLEADIVVTTSLLNTGVDIQGEFTDVFSLDITCINSLFQLLERERQTANVHIVTQNKLFYPSIWDEEEGCFVSDKSTSKTNVIQTSYKIIDWVNKDVLSDNKAFYRVNFHGDNSLYNNSYTDPYYAQNETYKRFIERYSSTYLISNLMTLFNIKYATKDLGIILMNEENKSEVVKVARETQRFTKELLVNEIAETRKESKKYNDTSSLARALDTKTSLYKRLKAITKGISKNILLGDVPTNDLGESLYNILDDEAKTCLDVLLIELIEIHCFQKSPIKTKLERFNGERVNESEFLEDVKGYMAHVSSAKYSKKKLIEIIEQLGYKLEGRKKLDNIINGKRERYIEVTISKN